jgi:hypothetical protein
MNSGKTLKLAWNYASSLPDTPNALKNDARVNTKLKKNSPTLRVAV